MSTKNFSGASLFYLLFVLLCVSALSAEENFLMIDGASGEKILELGRHVDKRMPPCSTFKIALSLMGFDSGILQDEHSPVWLFQEGYDNFLETWKTPQTPESWMRTSCLWFSRVLATQLGRESFQRYLAILDYGNQDASGGLMSAWLSTSLKISPREQVAFIQKMLLNEHPISEYAVQVTRRLLFIEELPDGWRLFGKTGWSGSASKPDGDELGWFVGWFERGNTSFPFAYTIREDHITLSERAPRVRELFLMEKNGDKGADSWQN